MEYTPPWPYCGERRKSPRSPARNQYEQQLFELMRDNAVDTFYNVQDKQEKPPVTIYEWNGNEI